ncbi:TSC22 domain family protein 4 isoform 2-T2 [Spinachia spinachia]
MSGGKKRSGFQITSVTSDSVVLTVLQSAAASCSPQGSSSQPTTPSLKRKYISHDAFGQGVGSSSRFRVVRLAVGGAYDGGRGEPYLRGRWTCTEFIEHLEGAGFSRVMDSMRHAQSLESLEIIGRDIDRGGVHSHYTDHLSGQPIKGKKEADWKEPMGAQGCDSNLSSPLNRSRHIPPPLRLDVDSAGRSVFRQSHSQPSSPPTGAYHPPMTPVRTPAIFSLDQAIFSIPGDASPGSSLIAIDNKIEAAMDLVKSHLMLAVREEVELLREQIRELQEKNQWLERENQILRTLTHNVHNT